MKGRNKGIIKIQQRLKISKFPLMEMKELTKAKLERKNKLLIPKITITPLNPTASDVNVFLNFGTKRTEFRLKLTIL